MKVKKSDKRVRHRNLKCNKEYYSVCCGYTKRMTVRKITFPEMLVTFGNNSHRYNLFLSDAGVVNCPNFSNNSLNGVFYNKEDALNWINSKEYKKRLAMHIKSCTMQR